MPSPEPFDPQRLIEEALRYVRMAAPGQPPKPVRITIGFEGEGPLGHILVPVALAWPNLPPAEGDATPLPRPRQGPPTRGCPGDVYRLLAGAGRRMTCPEILADFARAGVEWSERNVRRVLSDLGEQGWVDHDSRADPPGYGALGVPVPSG